MVVEHWEPWPIDQPTHGGPVGYKHLQDAFNQAKPGGYTVQTITPPSPTNGTFATALKTAIASGSSPDTFQQNLNEVALYAGQKATLALDSYMATDKFDLNQLFPFSVFQMKWDGKVYAMMQHTDINIMWYNTDLLRQTGLDPSNLPKTWDDLEQMALKGIKKNGPDMVQIGFDPTRGNGTPSWLQANGVKILSDDGRKATFDGAQAIETLEWLKKIYNQVDGGKAAVDAFQKNSSSKVSGSSFGAYENGKALSLNNGNWEADAIRRANKQLPLAVASLPSGPSGPKDSSHNVFMGGIFCALSATGKHRDGGWKYLQFIGGPIGGTAVETDTADVSGNIEASKNPTILNDPNSGFGRKDTQPLFPLAGGTRDIQSAVGPDVQYSALENAVSQVLQNKTDTATALGEAVKVANAALDKYYNNLSK